MSVGCVGYCCILSSLSCTLICVGSSLAKTSGVDLHSEVMYFCSVWHNAHVALGMGYICYNGTMSCGFAVELNGLKLGSGRFRNIDEISQQGSVCAE